jgi:mono/diheme cytochrome c family protein
MEGWVIELNRISALCVLGLLVVSLAFAAAQPGRRDLAIEVKSVFQAKCSECHGPQVQKPKGKFGYVLDLKKLAADPEKVVPSKPDESALWQLVRDEMMPAEGAKAGPLTKDQKETIRAWIEAGAPFTPIEPSAQSPANQTADSPSTPAAKKHFLDWLGNFHVVVVHFPIALLLAAAAGELWFTWRRVREPSPAVRFCVLLGAGSAIVTAVLGWLHAASGYGASSPSILVWHRWVGTAVAVWRADGARTRGRRWSGIPMGIQSLRRSLQQV